MRNKWDILVNNLNTAIDSIKSSLGELLQSYIDFYDAKIDKQQENVEYLFLIQISYFLHLLIPSLYLYQLTIIVLLNYPLLLQKVSSSNFLCVSKTSFE